MDIYDLMKKTRKGIGTTTTSRTTVPQADPAKFNITTPEAPSAGALQRGNSAREYMQTQAASAASEAMAGGAYGNTASALGALGQMRNQAGLSATQAANQMSEADLGRQLQVGLANQQGQFAAEEINARNYEANLQHEARMRALGFQEQVYGDQQSQLRRLREEMEKAARGSIGGAGGVAGGNGATEQNYLAMLYAALLGNPAANAIRDVYQFPNATGTQQIGR
jgi:hypothetical protein